MVQIVLKRRLRAALPVSTPHCLECMAALQLMAAELMLLELGIRVESTRDVKAVQQQTAAWQNTELTYETRRSALTTHGGNGPAFATLTNLSSSSICIHTYVSVVVAFSRFYPQNG